MAVLTRAAFGVQAADYLRLTGHVNTYTFTKMLTEMAIGEHHNSSFPVAIVRPSIVVSPPGLHQGRKPMEKQVQVVCVVPRIQVLPPLCCEASQMQMQLGCVHC